MKVNRYECVLSAVLHEEPPVTPQSIGFTNEMAKAKFAPFILRETGKRGRETMPAGSAHLDKDLRMADFLDNFLIGAGDGGFRIRKVVETGSDWNIAEWETGARWRVGTARIAWAREYIEYPVQSEDDLDELELPDPDDPSRYEGIEKAVRSAVGKGFFPTCSINGFFSGVWYFLRGPLEVTLKDMYMRKSFYKRLLARIGEFNLKAERNLLERGAQMIGWVDDLGYSGGTFIRPELYGELIHPWHVKAIESAHKYGAFVNMHSHGKIDAIVPLLAKAGLDVLNPVGPTDNMNLEALKDEYGDVMCFQGGLSKHIGSMKPEELRKHLLDRLRLGTPGGGFILSSEGDIPAEMDIRNFKAFLKTSRKYRRNRPDL